MEGSCINKTCYKPRADTPPKPPAADPEPVTGEKPAKSSFKPNPGSVPSHLVPEELTSPAKSYGVIQSPPKGEKRFAWIGTVGNDKARGNSVQTQAMAKDAMPVNFSPPIVVLEGGKDPVLEIQYIDVLLSAGYKKSNLVSNSRIWVVPDSYEGTLPVTTEAMKAWGNKNGVGEKDLQKYFVSFVPKVQFETGQELVKMPEKIGDKTASYKVGLQAGVREDPIDKVDNFTVKVAVYNAKNKRIPEYKGPHKIFIGKIIKTIFEGNISPNSDINLHLIIDRSSSMVKWKPVVQDSIIALFAALKAYGVKGKIRIGISTYCGSEFKEIATLSQDLTPESLTQIRAEVGKIKFPSAYQNIAYAISKSLPSFKGRKGALNLTIALTDVAGRSEMWDGKPLEYSLPKQNDPAAIKTNMSILRRHTDEARATRKASHLFGQKKGVGVLVMLAEEVFTSQDASTGSKEERHSVFLKGLASLPGGKKYLMDLLSHPDKGPAAAKALLQLIPSLSPKEKEQLVLALEGLAKSKEISNSLRLLFAKNLLTLNKAKGLETFRWMVKNDYSNRNSALRLLGKNGGPEEVNYLIGLAKAETSEAMDIIIVLGANGSHEALSFIEDYINGKVNGSYQGKSFVITFANTENALNAMEILIKAGRGNKIAKPLMKIAKTRLEYKRTRTKALSLLIASKSLSGAEKFRLLKEVLENDKDSTLDEKESYSLFATHIIIPYLGKLALQDTTAPVEEIINFLEDMADDNDIDRFVREPAERTLQKIRQNRQK